MGGLATIQILKADTRRQPVSSSSWFLFLTKKQNRSTAVLQVKIVTRYIYEVRCFARFILAAVTGGERLFNGPRSRLLLAARRSMFRVIVRKCSELLAFVAEGISFMEVYYDCKSDSTELY